MVKANTREMEEKIKMTGEMKMDPSVERDRKPPV